MITSWDIYWITRLDAISGFFVILFCASVVLTGAFLVFSPIIVDECFDDDWAKWRKLTVKLVVTTIILSIPACLVPTTKEAAAIYLIPKITNNEQVQKLPDNALKFLNGKFEAWIADMEKGKKEK